MSVEIIADENVDFRIILALRKEGWSVLSILEQYRGEEDKEIINLVAAKQGILLTEDKDFGEWVFAHKAQIGVILLRYNPEDTYQIITSILETLKKYGKSLREKFVVITPHKIRIRNL
ncbi:MAG: toxin-antitoxin system, toxin component [Calditrichaeota bacterium]|nr:MAG: toxin-antitoxin system, toxin component [Calditrichota bacterium]